MTSHADTIRSRRIDDLCDELAEEFVPPDVLAPIRAYAVWLRQQARAEAAAEE